MAVYVYSDDLEEHGKVDNLLADGVVERHTGVGWAPPGAWCCRIDSRGIRHESDETSLRLDGGRSTP
jgi:hypothetical protein